MTPMRLRVSIRISLVSTLATMYQLDFTRCSLCGACVEVCPTDAIRFSKNYNLASTRREDYVMDLYKDMKVKDP